jgi:hypothetical protein
LLRLRKYRDVRWFSGLWLGGCCWSGGFASECLGEGGDVAGGTAFGVDVAGDVRWDADVSALELDVLKVSEPG